MIRLYSRSGSQEVQILDKIVLDQVWDREKRNAHKLLKSRGYQLASDILKDIPFELRKGTNEFNDDFCVLYYSAPLDRYEAIANEYEEKKVKIAYQSIADILTEIGKRIRFIVLDLDINLSGKVLPVNSPSLEISNDAVQRALADAQNLIQDRGPASGIDRVHTAFHGYLNAVATKAEIQFKENSSIIEMFKLIRTKHPALVARDPRAAEIDHVLKSMSAIVDALNTIRNNASGAHPRQFILMEPEAMLIINSVNTLLHYLDARLCECNE